MILDQKEYDLKIKVLSDLLDKSDNSPLGKMIERLSSEIMEYEGRIYPPPIVEIKDRIEFLLDQQDFDVQWIDGEQLSGIFTERE